MVDTPLQGLYQAKGSPGDGCVTLAWRLLALHACVVYWPVSCLDAHAINLRFKDATNGTLTQNQEKDNMEKGYFVDKPLQADGYAIAGA